MHRQNSGSSTLPVQNMTCSKNYLAGTLLPLLFFTLPLQAKDDIWHTDFAAAKQKAAQENKDLLVHFTGSDWCGWCMKLNKEVFHDKALAKAINKDFILVQIDFPRRKELLPELSQQNVILKKKYNITGYPTVMLCDALGRPYAKTGYRKGGAAPYIAHINKLQERKKTRDTALALAENLEGPEKARTLEKALSIVPSAALSFYEKEIAAIAAADPDDVSGFYTRYQIQKTTIALGHIVKPLFKDRDYAKIIVEVDNYIRQHQLKNESLQTALLFKLSSHYLSKDYEAALKIANQIITINDVNRPGRYSSMIKKRILRLQPKK